MRHTDQEEIRKRSPTRLRRRVRRISVAAAAGLTVLFTVAASPAHSAFTCDVTWFSGGVEWVSPDMVTGECRGTSAGSAEWVGSYPRSSEWALYSAPNCEGSLVALGSGYRDFRPNEVFFASLRMNACK
ncbi:hypothetical protein AB0J38_22550 [Streptomyces sp. NPDC050095]|uniref:hypothetical protein n=1 Tax=unclassified Streptomyces TaxID=2593676 RepID=UPI00341392D0